MDTCKYIADENHFQKQIMCYESIKFYNSTKTDPHPACPPLELWTTKHVLSLSIGKDLAT